VNRVCCRLDEVAGSDRDELTGYRRSGITRSFLPQTKGASHGPCCYRSGREEITDLRAQRRRADRRREAVGYLRPEAVPGRATGEPCGRRDVCRSIRRCRCSEGIGPRGTGGGGDSGKDAGRRGTTHEDGSARRADAERGVVPGRFAVGPHPEDRVAGEEDLLRDAGRAGGGPDEGDQHGPRLAAGQGPEAGERKPGDVYRKSARCLWHGAARLRGEAAASGGDADRRDRRGRRGRRAEGQSRRDLSASDDRPRRRSTDGDSLRGSAGRREPIRDSAPGRVVPRPRSGRELELRASAETLDYEGGTDRASVGTGTGCLGAQNALSEAGGDPSAAVGTPRGTASRKANRDDRPGAKACRHPVRDLARRHRLRRQPRRKDDLRSDRHAAPRRSEGSGRQLSRDDDRGLKGEGPTTSFCRLRLVDGHSLCATKSANTRMRQPVDLPFSNFLRALSQKRCRTDPSLWGQPLHTPFQVREARTGLAAT